MRQQGGNKCTWSKDFNVNLFYSPFNLGLVLFFLIIHFIINFLPRTYLQHHIIFIFTWETSPQLFGYSCWNCKMWLFFHIPTFIQHTCDVRDLKSWTFAVELERNKKNVKFNLKKVYFSIYHHSGDWTIKNVQQQ